jgi:Ala-tRNA(Pro) deacylase
LSKAVTGSTDRQRRDRSERAGAVIGFVALITVTCKLSTLPIASYDARQEVRTMAIPTTLREFFTRQGTDFSVVAHARTGSSRETATTAHIPGDRVAKAVMVEDEAGYLMVVIPATHRLHLGRLHKALGREIGLATEGELRALFPDCEQGAIPPLGAAYGIDTVVDDALLQQTDVYLEAGDHERLIRLSGGEFRALMQNAARGQYSIRL